MTKVKEKPTGLALLREPFEAHQISKLPKQAGWMKDKRDEYTNCKICGGYHHPKAIHLDYVGHAALTDRLLDADPEWEWEPMAYLDNGAPALDKNGGLWIYLTVCGVKRIGYGHPDGKSGGDAHKETIGDALRNAAMRFGAALDLWHKGDLHVLDQEPGSKPKPKKSAPKPKPEEYYERLGNLAVAAIRNVKTSDALHEFWNVTRKEKIEELHQHAPATYRIVKGEYDKRLVYFANVPVDNDEIPH